MLPRAWPVLDATSSVSAPRTPRTCCAELVKVSRRKANQPCMFFYVDRMDAPMPVPVQRGMLTTIAECMPSGAIVHALLTHASVKPPDHMTTSAGQRSMARIPCFCKSSERLVPGARRLLAERVVLARCCMPGVLAPATVLRCVIFRQPRMQSAAM